MSKEVKLDVKIISFVTDKVIGWKGNVLEIGLVNQTKKSLCIYIANYLGMEIKEIDLVKTKNNIYSLTIKAKYVEDPRILFM